MPNFVSKSVTLRVANERRLVTVLASPFYVLLKASLSDAVLATHK
jgi:hypothetical protein